jgi:hypothetical protein
MKENKSPIRLQRVVIAALLAELIPLLVLVAVVTGYAYLVSPNVEAGVYKDFANRAGKLINPLIGALATFGMAYWAARKPESSKVLHGVFTGLVVIFIELAILATPGSEFGLSEGLGMAGKLAAGALGGFAALQVFRKNQLSGETGQPIL